MNKFKCINTKNYKLTLNQEYDILNEEDNYLILVNDIGKTVRYYKELFEEINEEAVPIAVRTEQDCINSITQTGDGIAYIDLNNNVVSINIDSARNISSTYISCGVYQISGLDIILERISNAVNTDDDDMIELTKSLFRNSILRLKRINTTTRFITLSTAFQEKFEDLYPVLDELSDSVTDWKVNPNSNNRIKVWVLSK